MYVSTGGSYTAATDQLYLQRNTVQHRVHQTKDLRGPPFTGAGSTSSSHYSPVIDSVHLSSWLASPPIRL